MFSPILEDLPLPTPVPSNSMCVCVCFCLCVRQPHTHTHTHHKYCARIWVLTIWCVLYVCVCARERECAQGGRVALAQIRRAHIQEERQEHENAALSLLKVLSCSLAGARVHSPLIPPALARLATRPCSLFPVHTPHLGGHITTHLTARARVHVHAGGNEQRRCWPGQRGRRRLGRMAMALLLAGILRSRTLLPCSLHHATSACNIRPDPQSKFRVCLCARTPPTPRTIDVINAIQMRACMHG